MVGVEVHDVVILCIVCSNVGEQLTNRTVDVAQLRPKLLPVDGEVGQADTEAVLFQREQTIIEGQMCFDLRRKLIVYPIPRVHICCVQEKA